MHQIVRIVLTVLSVAVIGSAQRLPENYTLVTYRKVPAGKNASYLAYAKNHQKKLAEARIQRGEAKGWTLLRLTVPYSYGSDHDFVSAYYYEKLPNFGRSRPVEQLDADAKAAGLANWADLSAASLNSNEIVHSHLLRGQWRIGSAKPGAVVRINYYKVPEGGMADAMEMEERIFMPMIKASLDSGAGILAWSLSTLVMPVPAEAGWNYITAATYKDWATMMAGPGISQENFAKVHPGKSYMTAMNQYRDRKILVKSRTYEIIEMVGAPVGAK